VREVVSGHEGFRVVRAEESQHRKHVGHAEVCQSATLTAVSRRRSGLSQFVEAARRG
jgi:hypothetical protein